MVAGVVLCHKGLSKCTLSVSHMMIMMALTGRCVQQNVYLWCTHKTHTYSCGLAQDWLILDDILVCCKN